MNMDKESSEKIEMVGKSRMKKHIAPTATAHA
jgi:hypothetical protein